MPPHPDICSLRPESGCCWYRRWVSVIVLMIEVPHSIHTHSRSSLYIHNVIQHLRQWLQVIRMPPHPDICYLRPLVFESHLECTYVCTYVMIETPQPLHTHIRSSLYIYYAIQNLQQWLQVIRMQHHTCNGKNNGLCVLCIISECKSTHCHGCRGYRPLQTGFNITFLYI